MSAEADEFDVALGHCRVRNGTLHIDRPDPEEMGRWATFRAGTATSAAHRPWLTAAWTGGIVALGVVFVALLVDLYTANPAVAPLVGGLAVLGLLAVTGPLEVNYRRAMRERRQLRASLAEEFTLARPTRVPIDAITGVTVRSVSTGLLLGDGHLLLVHYRTDGPDETTALGVPAFMAEERSTARAIFEQRGIPITDEEPENG